MAFRCGITYTRVHYSIVQSEYSQKSNIVTFRYRRTLLTDRGRVQGHGKRRPHSSACRQQGYFLMLFLASIGGSAFGSDRLRTRLAARDPRRPMSGGT